MGILDNLGEQANKYGDQIDDAIDKGGDFVDEKTGNKYGEQVDKAQDFLNQKADDLANGEG